MAQATTIILLPQTSHDAAGVVGGTITGQNQPAASYYFGNKDLQTLTWNLTSVTGLISIQASLAESPRTEVDDDWFTIKTISGTNTTQTSFDNLNGNFVWLRAKVTGFNTGTIQHIKVSY